MNRSELAGMDRTTVESMLGRRLRPWWGTSPVTLLLRGAVQGAVFALVAYGCLQVRAGELDLTGTGMEDKSDLIDRLALVGAALAGVGVLYGLLRVVIGVFDLFTRRSVEGTLVRAEERRTGDFLPPLVQQLWYRGQDSSGQSRAIRRRRRYVVVVSTPDGLKSWNVSHRLFQRARAGEAVKMRISPLLGHVSSLDATGPTQPAGDADTASFMNR